MEMSIAVNPKAEEGDGYLVVAAVVTSLAMLSYSLLDLLISMILTLIYIIWRSFGWY